MTEGVYATILRGSGWIKDCKEGKPWRMKKLGGLTSLDVKKERDKKNGEEEKDL